MSRLYGEMLLLVPKSDRSQRFSDSLLGVVELRSRIYGSMDLPNLKVPAR